jgi:hypothetical protein
MRYNQTVTTMLVQCSKQNCMVLATVVAMRNTDFLIQSRRSYYDFTLGPLWKIKIKCIVPKYGAVCVL